LEKEIDILKKEFQIKINANTKILKNTGVGGFGMKINGIKDIILIKSKKVIYITQNE
jgi:hypothetical protein